MIQITIANTQQQLFCPPGSNLYQVLAQAGLMERPCGGSGSCGKCKVQLFGAAIPAPAEGEDAFFSSEDLAAGFRLACRCYPQQNLIVALPSQAQTSKIASHGKMREFRQNPMIRKQRNAQGNTDVFRQQQLLFTEEGDTTNCCYGIAVDLGTTTVVATLADLHSGTELAVQTCLNSQNRFGQDVISRIHYASGNETGRAQLQQTILKDLQSLFTSLLQQSGISPNHIYEVTIGANPTMIHLLAGINPAPLGHFPYQTAFEGPLQLTAKELDLPILPQVVVYCLPAVAAFVGGDITAGVLACEIDTLPQSTLFLDIGTNGELVFTDGKTLCACSCAAGPALEGMNISCGVRAAAGAIEDVVITGESVHCTTIDNQPAIGLCGSGLLAAIGELNRQGILHKSGRFNEHPLVEKKDGKKRFCLDAQNGLYLTQQDIRQVQLAKGAILAGIYTLLEACNVQEENLTQILVAGQFGSHLKATSLTGAGLIPKSLEQRIHYVGNTSQSGALLCLLSAAERQRAEAIARQINYIELAQLPGYTDRFVDCMSF